MAPSVVEGGVEIYFASAFIGIDLFGAKKDEATPLNQALVSAAPRPAVLSITYGLAASPVVTWLWSHRPDRGVALGARFVLKPLSAGTDGQRVHGPTVKT